MADFCQTCAIEAWGFDTRDLAGLTTADDTAAGRFIVALCEGCGPIQVDHDGQRIETPPTPDDRATLLIRPRRITRSMLRAQPGTLFAFGDNMQRRGLGGQARDMRGEPNAVGVPTKHAPHTGPAAFFRDNDWDRRDVRDAINAAFAQLAAAVRAGRPVAIPADGLGTGRAELAARAPRIAAAIAARIARLETIATDDRKPVPDSTDFP